MVETALILAGGKGTRLKEFTHDQVPKPLVEVVPGVTMLDLAIRGLINVGIGTIVISVSHLREQISEYIESKYKGWNLDVLVENDALGTGGSIRNFISKGQNVPFASLPADNYLEYQAFRGYFRDADQIISGAILYWAGTTDSTYSQVPNNIWVRNEGNGLMKMVACTSGLSQELVASINKRFLGNNQYSNITSAGITVVNPGEYIKKTASEEPPFCIYKELVPRWALAGEPIYVGLPDRHTLVIDMGTPERLETVRKLLNNQIH